MELSLSLPSKKLVKTKNILSNNTGASKIKFAELVTPREQELLFYLAKGMPYKAIGHALSISASTVKRHMNNIKEKLNLSSRKEVTQIYKEATSSV